jgi:hypothetical protein
MFQMFYQILVCKKLNILIEYPKNMNIKAIKQSKTLRLKLLY